MYKIKLEEAILAVSFIIDCVKKDGGQPVAIAVTNENGVIILIASMDDSPERVINIAKAKAYTAARMRVATVDFLKRLREEKIQLEWFCDDNFSPLPGGIPIYIEKFCIGAVGISGRELDEDVRLAELCVKFFTSLRR